MITLQALLGTELPLIQAPMAGVQGSALAIAVSNAGGLGSLPCAMLSLEALRNELVALRAGTRRPYNVNFFCHTHPLPDAARDAAWRDALAPYYREFDLDASNLPTGAARVPFGTWRSRPTGRVSRRCRRWDRNFAAPSRWACPTAARR